VIPAHSNHFHSSSFSYLFPSAPTGELTTHPVPMPDFGMMPFVVTGILEFPFGKAEPKEEAVTLNGRLL